MASAYAKIIIVGHLGNTPELRYSKDGKPVTNLSVAVNEKYNGEEITSWYSVAVWNGRAENAVKYLKKGSKVLIEGSGLTAGAYIGKKDNQPHGTLNFTATQITYLDNAPDDNAEDEIPM